MNADMSFRQRMEASATKEQLQKYYAIVDIFDLPDEGS
jgi:hypothetical protein